MLQRPCWRCSDGVVRDKSLRKMSNRERKRLISINPSLKDSTVECIVCKGKGYLPRRAVVVDGVVNSASLGENIIYKSLGVCEEAIRCTDIAIKKTNNKRPLVLIVGAGIGAVLWLWHFKEKEST